MSSSVTRSLGSAALIWRRVDDIASRCSDRPKTAANTRGNVSFYRREARPLVCLSLVGVLSQKLHGSSWFLAYPILYCGSVAKWLACWTQGAQTGLGSNRSRNAVGWQSWANCSYPSCLCSPSSEIGSSPLKVNAGLAESNGSLPRGLWLTSPAGWLPRTGISSGTLRSAVEYGLPFLPCVARRFDYLQNKGTFWHVTSKPWT